VAADGRHALVFHHPEVIVQRYLRATAVAILGMLVLAGCENTSVAPDLASGDQEGRLAARGFVGQNLVTGGVGLQDGESGSFDITIPVSDASEILSATFYYNGGGPVQDNTVVINGTEYTADLLGVTASFFYKLDAIGLVAPGLNSFAVSGIDFGDSPGHNANGIGLAVVYMDMASDVQEVRIFELTDWFWWADPDGHVNSDVHNFAFDPMEMDRSAKLVLMVGECEPSRADAVWYHSGEGSSHPGDIVGGPYPNEMNVFNAAYGNEWDIYELETTVPMGAGHFAFQCESPEAGNGDSGLISFAALLLPEPEPECEGVIGDFVWYDMNENGLQDMDEPGIMGVQVTLYDGDQNMLAMTTTDENGYYMFSGLCAGMYYVESDTPEGYEPTECEVGDDAAIDSNCQPAAVMLETDDDSDLTIDFGFIEPMGGEGCTPGYWKNHPEDWYDYMPGQTVMDMFSGASNFPDLADDTLMEALDYGGGGGLVGMARNLLRIGVASVLNATSDYVDYPYTEGELIDMINMALDSGDRGYMEDVKNELDFANNDLPCPL
jgi:hypothetical protein